MPWAWQLAWQLHKMLCRPPILRRRVSTMLISAGHMTLTNVPYFSRIAYHKRSQKRLARSHEHVSLYRCYGLLTCLLSLHRLILISLPSFSVSSITSSVWTSRRFCLGDYWTQSGVLHGRLLHLRFIERSPNWQSLAAHVFIFCYSIWR